MNQDGIFRLIQSKRLAVISTTNGAGRPEAALIGFAFDAVHGVVFDTSAASRKARNLRTRPYAALVVGWDDETTVQIEGVAREPAGGELDRMKEAYFEIWPDGRARATWPDIAYFVIEPTWMRCSRYSDPMTIVECRGPFGGPARGA